MILLALMHLLQVAVSWLCSLMPVANVSALNGVGSGVGYAWGTLAALNTWFPVNESLAVMTIMLAIMYGAHVVNLIRRVFSLFWPGAGS